MTKYISVVDTAKMIRKALKEAFGAVKFSVVSDKYSGGASIRVKWTDGPNQDQVKAIAQTFQGGYFDGMQDYAGSTYAMIDGEKVHFGADYVFFDREYSDKAVQLGIDRVYAKFSGNFKEKGIDKPTVEDFRKGALWNKQLFWDGAPYDQNVQQEVFKMLGKASDRVSPSKSPTASKVIYLGNDGYSPIGALDSQYVEGSLQRA